jgi:hypothetical protein
MLGRPNGVGFEIGVAFQLFDVTRILAYALAFIAVMLTVATFLVQPRACRATEVLACGKDLDARAKAERDARKDFEAAKWQM